MKSIFSLLIVFTLSAFTMSFGYATPNDDKIEKVFADELNVAIDAVEAVEISVFDFSNEIVKVANVDVGIVAVESVNFVLFNTIEVFTDIRTVDRKSNIYNSLQNHNGTPYNLPLKVGWNGIGLNK